jgi:hypothetical protein
MKSIWVIWPKRKLGGAAILLACLAITLFAVLSLGVEFLSQRTDNEATVINIGLIPGVMAVMSIILGWSAFVVQKDRSIILLVTTLAMSFQTLFVAVFEVLEALL